MPVAQQAPRGDFTIDQRWEAYTREEHEVWRTLFARQSKQLPGRAAPEFLDGLSALGVAAEGIPDFRRLSEVLDKATGWRIVAVPGLVPDDIFFDHLANRRFPSTCFIRSPEQMDYIQEPDVFHDIFGHVPLLVNPVFADYMRVYGEKGREALALGHLDKVARLYWYTVEFGLIRTAEGLRIYGSGIVSSKGEVAYCLEDPCPQRVRLDLERVMRSRYRIDTYQETYFVIDDYAELAAAIQSDLASLYSVVAAKPELAPGEAFDGDEVVALQSE